MEQLFNRQGEPRTPNGFHANKPVYRYDRPCSRCGGAGGSDKWYHTGWTCYRCEGRGIDPTRGMDKLYTQAKLDSLNAIKARADERRAAARAEKERLEKIRQAEECEELHARYADFIVRLSEEMKHSSMEIISDVHYRLVELVQEPTDRQIEVCNQIIERNQAERARKAAATHVGEIKERRLFTLTLISYRFTPGNRYSTWDSHWSLFSDEEGRRIACKSAPWLLGLTKVDGQYERGQTVTVKATVAEHSEMRDGEPVTYINRPKEA